MCPVQNVSAPALAVPGRAADATDFLDGWRGLAALEVVVCHLFALTMASKLFAPPPGSSDVLTRAAFYIVAAPFRFGVAAVWFFFVIHLPIATFVCAIVLRWLGPRAIGQRLATTPAILVLILVIAYFLHLFVERPFLAKSRRASLPQPIAAVVDPTRQA